MIIKYYANDGTEFNDRFACIDYERKELTKKKELFEGLFMWGRDGNLITDLEQIESAWFVFIKDQKTLNLLNETITLYSSFPYEVGGWVYDERQDCFIPLDEVVSKMEKKLKMCKDFEYQAIVATKAPF
jgi:hypothetical protein